MTIPSELIAVILERTSEGKLSWSELSNAAFTAPIKPNSLIIDRKVDRNADVTYELRIANEMGTVLEIDEDYRPNGILAQIYELARRQALRVDETLVSIKNALEKL
jgi:hypothetical protein